MPFGARFPSRHVSQAGLTSDQQRCHLVYMSNKRVKQPKIEEADITGLA